MKYSLSNLLVNINYQQHYSYDKRVDLFNKYGIPTSTLEFIPIYRLSNFILSKVGYNPNSAYGYGHGNNVLNILEKSKDYKNNNFEFKYVEKNDNGYEFAQSPTAFNGVSISYWSDDTILHKVKINATHISLPRENIYDLIDEWLNDFEFN